MLKRPSASVWTTVSGRSSRAAQPPPPRRDGTPPRARRCFPANRSRLQRTIRAARRVGWRVARQVSKEVPGKVAGNIPGKVAALIGPARPVGRDDRGWGAGHQQGHHQRRRHGGFCSQKSTRHTHRRCSWNPSHSVAVPKHQHAGRIERAAGWSPTGRRAQPAHLEQSQRNSETHPHRSLRCGPRNSARATPSRAPSGPQRVAGRRPASAGGGRRRPGRSGSSGGSGPWPCPAVAPPR